LRWGNWRELPNPRDTLSPATFPEQRELTLLVNHNDIQYERLIRPRTHGATAVSVSDVIEAVEYEARWVAGQRPAGGVYPYNGRAIRRTPGAIWEWCGLDESPRVDDVWVLYL